MKKLTRGEEKRELGNEKGRKEGGRNANIKRSRSLRGLQAERAKGILLESASGIGLRHVLPSTPIDFLAANPGQAGFKRHRFEEERGGRQIGTDAQRFADENILRGRRCCCNRSGRLLLHIHGIGSHPRLRLRLRHTQTRLD